MTFQAARLDALGTTTVTLSPNQRNPPNTQRGARFRSAVQQWAVLMWELGAAAATAGRAARDARGAGEQQVADAGAVAAAPEREPEERRARYGDEGQQ